MYNCWWVHTIDVQIVDETIIDGKDFVDGGTDVQL